MGVPPTPGINAGAFNGPRPELIKRALTQTRLGGGRAICLAAVVRRTLQVLTLCLAWLCANGALWDVVQVFAWGKMVHDYSQVMPLAQAITKTFDGSAPCEICTVVDDAKQSQPAQQVERSQEKILLACQVPEEFFVIAPDFAWPGGVDAAGLIRTERVPVPPPRC